MASSKYLSLLLIDERSSPTIPIVTYDTKYQDIQVTLTVESKIECCGRSYEAAKEREALYPKDLEKSKWLSFYSNVYLILSK